MNEIIINEIAKNLNIRDRQVTETLKLLSEDNTIPFIARYRKEATGGLDEVLIKEISDVYQYQINLEKRKDDVIRLIEEKDLMTPVLKEQILKCEKLIDVEDLYRPFKEKKKTKASEAIKNGLEPLAKLIMTFPANGTLTDLVNSFICDKDLDYNKKLEGAKYIIAENISDNATYRKWIRDYIKRNGTLSSKIKKNAKDEKSTYEMYYEYEEKIVKEKPYRILAMNRGEKEEVLNVSVNIDNDEILKYLERQIITNEKSFVSDEVKYAIIDAYKRLIFPSIEREIRSELTLDAEGVAIDNFSLNVSNLLMTPPMKEIVVLGFDPAFRTGCKLAVLDKVGKVLNISVIYPHEPRNEKDKSKEHILNLINKYNVDVVAIGNGTASRESEAFIADTIKGTNTKYIIVNEAGASVYSASNLAIKEFPELDVAERSAISIGRRLQDPLSELVKIDPKSIGVGLYQHDVRQKELDTSLTFVVGNVVNNVGVNINTASKSILSYISGLTNKAIDALLNKKEDLGKFKSREELKKVKGLTSKIYEQAIGFIRINDGINPLDKTNIHPESYEQTKKLLELINCTVADLGTDKLKQELDKQKIADLELKLNIDRYTLEDIIKSLKMPLLDPRDDLKAPLLKSDILTIDNLKKGMKLQGIVRNVIDFGAFIDIGLKNDGLVHISQISDKFIKHPNEVLSVGNIVDCYVLDINIEKNKVALTLLEKNI